MSDAGEPLPGGPAIEDLEDLYENAPCGYLSLDRKGRIVKVNATLARWLELDKQALLGKRLLELLNTPGAMFYETHFAPLLRMQGYFNEVALDLRKSNGTLLPTLANAAERRDDRGELLFIRVTIFLAADRRRYERQLVEARRAADRLRIEFERGLLAERATSELREQFVAVLGHDLRNPVAAIDAGAKMLQRENLSPKASEIVQLMRASVKRIVGLIDDVLDLTRSRLGGGIEIRADAAGDVAETTKQVVEELRTAHPESRIELKMNVLERTLIDHGRFGQLVSNLLGNALTHGAVDQPVEVSLDVSKGRLKLVIANSGKPIPPDVIPRLFQPFYRGDEQRGRSGLGLGLFIASEIARAHGGRIDVESDETATRFTFIMPSVAHGSPSASAAG